MEKIIHNDSEQRVFPGLLVGHQTLDDAAVMDLGDGRALISTTDFFMPIVDDAYNFGRIASCNSMSDVYAMGGKPIMAIAILGWPVDKIDPAIGAKVLQGARDTCDEANIPLAGGHSIDAAEPFFGLAVNGIVALKNLKRNSDAKAGDKLFLTKAVGVGILTTAQKKKLIEGNDLDVAVQSMCTLNSIGEKVSLLPGVNAMTDVTGFGLGGHLLEVCQASELAAMIDFAEIPLMPKVEYYRAKGAVPGGTLRNFESYAKLTCQLSDQQKQIIFDPQTNGGLLVTVSSESEGDFLKICRQHGLQPKCFGVLSEQVEDQPLLNLKK